MYADYLRELEDEAEVIAVDRLGYGKSKGDGVVTSFEEQAAAIAPLLKKPLRYTLVLMGMPYRSWPISWGRRLTRKVLGPVSRLKTLDRFPSPPG